MATITRQPFAPLNEARLQTLTSLKNRQNAASTAPIKRKASEIVESDDFENVDPIFFSKRSKGTESYSKGQDFFKPSTFILTKAASTPSLPISSENSISITSPIRAASPRPRSFLQPKSPASKLNTSIAKSSPLFAPAGRSPTRGKRAGLLSSRRRTAGPYTRVDPPVFGLSPTKSVAPFSLDAALKGTIPSYSSRNASTTRSTSTGGLDSLHEPESKSSWFFDIHEDTPEQEMTNLLQHSTCVLDISSDEESESKRQRERDEGKENIAPLDDVSQTSRVRAARIASADDMIIEKQRNPLGEMNAADYYAEGCDEKSIILIPGDEEEQTAAEQSTTSLAATFEFAPQLNLASEEETPAEPKVVDGLQTADELMKPTEEPAAPAAVLEPMEGTGESFEVWESGSTKDDGEVPEAIAVAES